MLASLIFTSYPRYNSSDGEPNSPFVPFDECESELCFARAREARDDAIRCCLVGSENDALGGFASGRDRNISYCAGVAILRLGREKR